MSLSNIKLYSTLVLLYLCTSVCCQTNNRWDYYYSGEYIEDSIPNLTELEYAEFSNKLDDSYTLIKGALRRYINPDTVSASLLGKLGTITYLQGNYAESIELLDSSRALYLNLNRPCDAALALGSIAYQGKKRDVKRSLNQMRTALSEFKLCSYDENLSALYNNLGVIHELDSALDSAIIYYNKSLEVLKDLGDTVHIVHTYHNLAFAEQLNGNVRNGIKILKKSFEREKLNKDLYSMAWSYLMRSDMYQELNNLSMALLCADSSVYYATVIDYPDLLSRALEKRAEVHFDLDNFKMAFVDFKRFHQINAELNSDKIQKQALALETKFDLKEKQHQIEKLNSQKKFDKLKLDKERLENERQRSFSYFLMLVVVVIALLLILFIRNYNIKRRANKEILYQKHLVEEKNREILDSITYAQRIQNAMLPPINKIKKAFTDAFVLYLPKDIVAGDFYWMHEDENYIFIAAADCTGHGVPGAMVSIVCNHALNKSVNELGLDNTNDILNATRKIVIQELAKNASDVKDGMDIALIRVSKNRSEKSVAAQFSGALNSLWIQRFASNKIEEVKADKQPIGFFSKISEFTAHHLELNLNDQIYLFSDGYADQFGGEKGKKYKSGRFKKFLEEISEYNMQSQHDILISNFEEWRGQLEQLDDICVIGLKI